MGGKNTPDFQGLAQADTEQGKEALMQQNYANRPTQYSPWGYTNWTSSEVVDPSTGKPVTEWSQTTGLTPELQSILDKQIAIQGGRSDIAGMLTGRLGNEYGQAVNWNNLAPMGGVPTSQFTAPEGSIGDPNQFRQQGADASYNAAMNRVTPQFAEQRRAAEVKMRNQGLGPEDAAWKAQMEGIGNNENDARNQAIWGAQQAGRDESQQMYSQLMGQNQNMFNQALGANQQNYGQAMQGSQYANQIRQQQMAEMMQQRGFGLNEINALMSGQQVGMPSMPNFSQSGVNSPQSQTQAGVAHASAQNAASPWAGIGNLAGSAMMAGAIASDRRLKKNIKRIGTVKGHPWYSYDYIWGQPSQGVMADEVPEYAVMMDNGYMAVDYGRLLGD